jgi:hypothetical protein
MLDFIASLRDFENQEVTFCSTGIQSMAGLSPGNEIFFIPTAMRFYLQNTDSTITEEMSGTPCGNAQPGLK